MEALNLKLFSLDQNKLSSVHGFNSTFGRFCFIEQKELEIGLFGYIGQDFLCETDEDLISELLEANEIDYTLNSDNLPLIETSDYVIHSLGRYSAKKGQVILSPLALNPYREGGLDDNTKLVNGTFSRIGLQFILGNN